MILVQLGGDLIERRRRFRRSQGSLESQFEQISQSTAIK